ncbi:MAG: hypothetical protein ETSY2_40350 [Candidatus Entotheonella gemina]|uniref:Uncharacterized protein n=1 Tax=Candidatus Entotheonella gemina TaxID=1429439 RepID=W4LP14_9BACT|nr:MAG: hypothetical protein ETSY2_40350 [Candidatus Entotheonella gemina]
MATPPLKKKTGIYPINHTVVIKDELVQEVKLSMSCLHRGNLIASAGCVPGLDV